MTERTDTERDDASSLFERILLSDDHRLCVEECTVRAENEQLAEAFDALLDATFEDGVLVGRAQMGAEDFC